MGNHNLCDSAATDGVQKGEETSPFPVEAAACIFDELVAGLGKVEVGTLPFEVIALMGTADAGITNASTWLLFFESDKLLEVVEVVETLAFPALAPDNFDLALFCPRAKSA